MLEFWVDRFETPIGEIVIVADPEGNLRAIDWTEYEERMKMLLRRHYGETGYALRPRRDPGGLSGVLRRYFSGELTSIDALPTMTAGTAFQQSVWRVLRQIPCGETITYTELAKRIGKPAAVRAVGLANGANPIGIVVPCHRVIGANGSLTGYGGGIERKRWLLQHEASQRSL